jgi:hypothetical protein
MIIMMVTVTDAMIIVIMIIVIMMIAVMRMTGCDCD